MEKLLAELIAIPSQSGEEDQIAKYVSDWIEQHGLKTFEQNGNAVCHIPGVNRNRALILSGHLDTVDVGDIEKWHTDPFEPIIKDGKMYGLGASDMKAGVAVLMQLAAHYAEQTPECDLWFAFVRNEEVDGSGTDSFAQWFKEQPIAQHYDYVEAVITEPTDASFVEHGHRGNQFVKIAVTSESGHASQPEKISQPSIRVAGKIIAALQGLQETWGEQFGHTSIGNPSVALTGLWAGDAKAPNKIAGKAVIQLDIRTTPELHDKTEAELNSFLKTHSDRAKVIACEGSPAGWTDESSRLRQLFKSSFPEFSQKVMQGSSDLCYFTSADIPAILYGPGQKKTMHNVNEYAELRSLEASLVTLKKVVSLYAKD